MKKKFNLALLNALIVTCSILLTLFLWRHVELPFVDKGIVGIYSINKYNSYNDFLRYFFFIFIPSAFFLLFKFYQEEKKFFSKIKIFFSQNIQKNIDKEKNLISYFIFIFINSYLLIEFLSIEFPIHKIDSYHDGQRLSSAYKSFLDGSLWSGSYVIRGIFYETIFTKIMWETFGHISIGLARYVEIINILILKLSLVILSFMVSKLIYLQQFKKNIFFITSSLLLINFSDYDITNTDPISYRDLSIIFLLILFIFKDRYKNHDLVLISISSISLFSMLWGIDRGLICNFLIIIILFELFLSKNFYIFFKFIIFLTIFWSAFYAVNPNEFLFFLSNTKSVISDMSNVLGIIHPIPFSDDSNSSRAVKTLILIIICLTYSLNLIFKNENNNFHSFNKFLFYLAIICVLNYVHALGRSDGPHIKSGIGMPLIFFSFVILDFYLKKFNKDLLIIIFICLSGAYLMYKINIGNVLHFKERFKSFVFLNDEFYLDNELMKRLTKLKQLNINTDCVDLFTYDAAILYLIRKPSCTKFYYSYSLGSIKNQNKFINELNINYDSIIITNGLLDYWDPIEKKYKFVYSFIKKNYYILNNEGYLVLKKNFN